MTEYHEVLPFLCQEETFALGFECGTLYAEFCQGRHEFAGMYHVENEDHIRMMASRLGYIIEWQPLGPEYDEWAHARFVHA